MRTSIVLLVLLAPLVASAQEEPGLRDLVHARSLGMGMAYRGTGLGADIVGGNPAMMAAFRRFQFDLSGTWDWGNRFAFAGTSIIDSQTNALAAGVSYQLVALGRGETRRTAHVNTLALGFPLLDFLLVGVSGRHLLMSGAASANAITMDAGLALKLGESLSLGASAHNLIDTTHPELSRYYTASAGFMSGLFSLGVDARMDFNGPDPRVLWSAGGEYVFGRGIPVRGGYSFDTLTGSHFLSAGAGLFTEGGGLDFAYRTELNGPARQLSVTFRTLMGGG